MAKDHYTSRGLTTPEMMVKALAVRNDFEIAHVERVDIVSILEFKLVQRFPRFRLIIRQDSEMETNAFADPANDRIVVRRSIYRAACEDNPEARLILAHELGHFLLHREKHVTMHMDPSGSIQPIKRMSATESTEDQADMFARHFLAPPQLAYRFRHDAVALALATSVPLRISRGNVTMCKRPDVFSIRSVTSATPPL
ncbi:hypothetical protein GGI64_000804 [Rhizobium leguminosarum]|uniref:Peptidase M48 domain-containing protein n=1 Tax=Rhizobium leguminosarum TaxID=384 RepID=A0A7Z0IWC0_RHILE|nr:M48 family metalloprotease [Rhizobium leguminosarum]NYJ09785.1 hypothetical protein [Rhizobium leguminosarum]